VILNQQFRQLELLLTSVAICSLMGSCSRSFPAEQSCEKRISHLMEKSPIQMEYVHTKLLFDFSNANAKNAADIVKYGYAGSGQPGFAFSSVSNHKPHFVTSVTVPVITESGKEIWVDSFSGLVSSVITKACALESDGVWLRSISAQPYSPTVSEP
jgi:hypothetical protein